MGRSGSFYAQPMNIPPRCFRGAKDRRHVGWPPRDYLGCLSGNRGSGGRGRVPVTG